MENMQFVAYVSTYTSKDKRGITLYDVDMETGVFTEKGKVAITKFFLSDLFSQQKVSLFHYRFRS